jgi:uncharacterized membrane-anchored protein
LDLGLTAQAVPAITEEWIAGIHDDIVATLTEGSAAQKKALAKRLIVQVEIDGKVAYPKYRVAPQQGFDGVAVPLSDVTDT